MRFICTAELPYRKAIIVSIYYNRSTLAKGEFLPGLQIVGKSNKE